MLTSTTTVMLSGPCDADTTTTTSTSTTSTVDDFHDDDVDQHHHHDLRLACCRGSYPLTGTPPFCLVVVQIG